jgi:hypothetical protein
VRPEVLQKFLEILFVALSHGLPELDAIVALSAVSPSVSQMAFEPVQRFRQVGDLLQKVEVRIPQQGNPFTCALTSSNK